MYAKLHGDGPLTALAGVYDQPPEPATYPYVTIGEAVENRDDTFGRQGRMILATLHVWSRADGFSEALGILDNLNRLLDRAALAVSGMTLISCEYENATPLRDPDGITRHLAVRYRVRVEA
jgi:hypothetical protein